MLVKKNTWLKAAAVLAFFMGSALVSAQTLHSRSRSISPALQDLTCGFVLNGLDAIPTPQEIAVPEAAPAKAADEDRAAGAAPAAGRDFNPVIHDQNRTRLAMSLIGKIHNGQPLPYAHDGTTFTNKEGRLPRMPKGFYKEYTLIVGDGANSVVIGNTSYPVAPALSARGAERIIIGGREKIYYTPDHYGHFIELAIVY